MLSDLVPMGDAAWRLRLPPGTDPAAAQEVLRAHPGVLDAVVAGDVAMVRFVPGHPPTDPRPLFEALPAQPETERRHHVVQVRYDGEDLEEVARITGLSQDEVIARHSGCEYTVELIGFLPGYAYLGPVDPALVVPRRATPRPRVRAGAVGLAAGRTGIYPFATPGGWQLIGTAIDFKPFDPAFGSVFRLGDRVRFQPVAK